MRGSAAAGQRAAAEVGEGVDAKALVEVEIQAPTGELALTPKLKAKAFAAEIRQQSCRIFGKMLRDEVVLTL